MANLQIIGCGEVVGLLIAVRGGADRRDRILAAAACSARLLFAEPGAGLRVAQSVTGGWSGDEQKQNESAKRDPRREPSS